MQINQKEIERIRGIVELSVGTLMLIQEQELKLNEAERLKLFITSTRTMARTILWATTVSHFQLHYFIWRISLGFNLQLDLATEYMIQYGCAILEELKFYERMVESQGLLEEGQDPEELAISQED
jgi:hypothetical protein